MDLSFAVAGGLVGFLVGLTGVGGGSLMAPALILMFGFSPTVAVGTDLWFAAITKTIGGYIHRQAGTPDWQVIRRLSLGSIPAAIVTLTWLGTFHAGRLDPHNLSMLLAIALLATAVLMPFKSHLRAPLTRFRDRMGGDKRRKWQVIATVLSGAVVGVLVSLTSIGAGSLVAALLIVLYPLRLDSKSIVGTDIVHAIPLALVAAIAHSLFGNVDWALLANLLIGSVPGIIAGSLLAGRINEYHVRLALSAMLAIAAGKLLAS